MRVVIADDLSGAAEIAGIAHRLGWSPAVVTREAAAQPSTADLLVVDAHTREISAAAAGAVWSNLTHALRERFPAAHFFKKCDSVLRGHVAAESHAMATALGARRIRLLPANPSRGRTIRDATYFIDGQPLHTTPFGRDPHHPARTSSVHDLIGPDSATFEIGDLGDSADLTEAITRTDATTLVVGAADAFTAWCPPRPPPAPTRFVIGSGERGLIIHGSKVPLPEAQLLRHRFRCFDPAAPLADIRTALHHDRRVHAQVGPTDLVRLQALARLSAEIEGVHLALTGGATARAACDALGWQRFTVSAEWAPGVVSLLPHEARSAGVSLKPGSYSWPDAFLHHLFPLPAS